MYLLVYSMGSSSFTLPSPEQHSCDLPRRKLPSRCPKLLFSVAILLQMHSVRNLQRRATLCSRLRFGNGSVDRNFASRAFLADHIVQTPISYDVAIAFTSVSNVAAAPTCLLSFDNHYASAPAIMDLETKLETAYQNRALGLYGSIKPYEMDLAACLASPVTVEESAAEILRSTAAQLASEQQARLQMRCESCTNIMIVMHMW